MRSLMRSRAAILSMVAAAVGSSCGGPAGTTEAGTMPEKLSIRPRDKWKSTACRSST